MAIGGASVNVTATAIGNQTSVMALRLPRFESLFVNVSVGATLMADYQFYGGVPVYVK